MSVKHCTECGSELKVTKQVCINKECGEGFHNIIEVLQAENAKFNARIVELEHENNIVRAAGMAASQELENLINGRKLDDTAGGE